MNKVTLSSVKDVIPDIGGKAPKFFERAVTGPHSGLAQLV
jgi:hypothetical protein